MQSGFMVILFASYIVIANCLHAYRGDLMDELMNDVNDECRENWLKCNNNTTLCVMRNFFCDGSFINCPDGEDEGDICTEEFCESIKKAKCKDSAKCVSKSLLCEGDQDCPNVGDKERICTDELCQSLDRVKCKDSAQCIMETSLCDGYNDCPNNCLLYTSDAADE